jgi:hypothetical protein
MKNTETKFIVPLHLACGKDDLRPVMQCIYFDADGYAWSTDAHIMIKHKILDSDIIDKKNLIGKMIHKDIFAKIIKYKTIQATDEGVLCFDKDDNSVLYPYDNRKLTPLRYYTAVPNNELQPITYLSFDTKILKRLSDILKPFPIWKFEFRGSDKVITIKIKEFDTIILVMPLHINNSEW